MNRRYFLKGLGAGTSSLGLPASASTAKSCKVIGVGAAGWNFVQFAWRSSTLLKSDEWGIDFICVDSDPHVLKEVADENATKPGQVSIKTLALETFACANRNHMGRVAAFRQRDAISDLFAHTDVIFLVTGLGRKTGSSALPVMAKLARQAGALVIAPVITPFKFEGKESQQIADAAINHLKREADLVVEFQNEQLMVLGGETLTQSDAFALQNLGIAMCIRSLMDFVSSAEFA